MRSASLGLVIASLLALPASSAVFNCDFLKDGNSVSSCTMDSAVQNSHCFFQFAPTLASACLPLRSSETLDYLICVFAGPQEAVPLASRALQAGAAPSARMRLTPTGFAAASLAMATPASPASQLIYVEKANEPQLSAVCVRR